MTTTPDAPNRFPMTYRIRNVEKAAQDTIRAFDVHATPEEIARFAADGYLVRERFFSPERTQILKDALDEVAAREQAEAGLELSTHRAFGGLFLRHLMDKHPAFLELFRCEAFLSIARAMLGPQIQVLPMTGRISYPDAPNQETHWHHHQRVFTDPVPPFFCRPHVLDALLYLDELNDANGPLSIVPGTHWRTDEDLAAGIFGELPGQVTLRLPAGSVVFIHGNLWHRAHATTPRGTVRRLLIQPYAAAWLKLPSYGAKPANGLMTSLYANADTETRELLGIAEGLY